jgi:glutathione S-transferase
MLRLHGFSSSNYYNTVKLALLEKGLAFEEVLIYTGADETHQPEYLDKSPLGKVPCLETEEGFLSESRCIIEYLEHAHPQPPLFPPSAFARGKMRELMQVIELYLELPARRLLPNVFAGTEPQAFVADDVRKAAVKGTKALRRLARFDGYLVGDRFTAADISATVHLPAVRFVLGSTLKEDPLADVPGLADYMARMEDRPAVKKIRADRAANFPEFVAHLRARFARPKA